MSKKSIRYATSFLLTALFMYLAFRGIDRDALWNSLRGVHWGWMVLLFLGSIVSHLARAWRWQYLLYPIKPTVSLRNSFSAVMIGYMVNNFLPRVGEFVRPYTIGNLENISKSASLGTVVIERIIDMITFLSILLIVFFLYTDSFAQLFPGFESLKIFFLLGAILLTGIFILLFFKADLFFSLLRKLLVIVPRKLRNKVESKFDSFVSGFGIANHPGKFAMIALSSYVVWGLYIVMMYLPFFSFDAMVAHRLDFGAATFLMVVSGVAFAFPTSGGFGTYHSFTSFTLTQLFHIDPVTALSYSILTHEVGFFSTTSIGMYFFIKDHVRVSDVVAGEQQ
ncbi:MAG: lysylphosphatidylglycerol synthase transmembrane domain-containing protein [Ignavibacteriales bacterium]|nr:lysylphosphatidylglycerol synthase transmembrane domain-containing protein [Ignavibacteriales bacterium]